MYHLSRLAVRNLWRNRMRTLITLCAIVFGVSGLVLSGGFVRDIFVQLGEALIHSQSGHLQIGREAVFTHGSRTPERYLIEDHERVRATVRALPEVKDVMARIAFSGLLNNGKTDYPIIAEGVEPGRENALGTHLHLVSGRMLNDDDRFGAMIGDGVARALRLAPGDQATLLVSTIDGAMNTLDVEVVGVFQTFSKDFDARAVRIALPDAQDLLATLGVSRLVVSLHETDSTQGAVAALQSTLAPDGLVVRDWMQLNDFYGKTVDLYRQQFGFLKAMVLLMVCLSVINTVNMSLVERSWEFGTMRALGNTNHTVASLIIGESAVLGLLGATGGVLIGVALALLISGVGIPMPPPPNADLGYDAFIRIVPSVIVESWFIGFAATAVAALYPAWRLSRQSIIAALRTRE